MRFDGNAFCWWHFEIAIQDFPQRLVEFFQTLPSGPLTRPTEELGKQIVAHDFPREEMRKFITAVCKWGNYPGIAARIIQKNDPDALAALFRQAHQDARDTKVVEALTALQRVNGLGYLSPLSI